MVRWRLGAAAARRGAGAGPRPGPQLIVRGPRLPVPVPVTRTAGPGVQCKALTGRDCRRRGLSWSLSTVTVTAGDVRVLVRPGSESESLTGGRERQWHAAGRGRRARAGRRR
jgi:hypothetical protein